MVKDEGRNLGTMIAALEDTVGSPFLSKAFDANCYAHAVSKSASEAFKIDFPLLDVIIPAMQKLVTWTKKSGVASDLLAKAQATCKLRQKKLASRITTRFAITIAWCGDLLKNQEALRLLYGTLVLENDLSKAKQLNERLPPDYYWTVIEVIYKCTKTILVSSVLQQTRDFWLISDGVMNLVKLYINMKHMNNEVKEVIKKVKAKLPGGYKGTGTEFASELTLLDKKMRMAVRRTLLQFLQPLYKFNADKAHVFLCLRLDPRYRLLKEVFELQNADEYELDQMKGLDGELFKLSEAKRKSNAKKAKREADKEKRQNERKRKREEAEKKKPGKSRKRKTKVSANDSSATEGAKESSTASDTECAPEATADAPPREGTESAGKPKYEDSGVKMESLRKLLSTYDQNVLIPLLINISRHEDPALVNDPNDSEKEKDDYFSSLFCGANSELEMPARIDPYEKKVQDILRSFTYSKFESQAGECPLQWWRQHGHLFSHLSTAAKLVFSVAASEIENERVFSFTGIMSALRRNRIGVELMNNMLTIDYNYAASPLSGLQPEQNQISWSPCFPQSMDEFLDVERAQCESLCDRANADSQEDEEILKEKFGFTEDDFINEESESDYGDDSEIDGESESTDDEEVTDDKEVTDGEDA